MDDGLKAKEDLISELNLLRDSVQVSEERWRLALEGGVDGSWEWNTRTGEVLYSGRFKEIFGYEIEEATAHLAAWSDRVHPDDKIRVKEHLEKFLEGTAQTRGIEHRVQCKDGTYKWVFARGKIVSRTDEGKPLRVIGAFMDITERKEAEEALKWSEHKYRALFENANDAIVLMDGEAFIDCNERTLEMFRCRKEQVMGKTPFDFSAATQATGRFTRASIKEKLRGVISGESRFFEWRQRRPDGTTFDSEVRISKVDLGDSPAIQIIVSDTTDRKASEEALRESEAKFRNLAENSVAGIYLIQDDRLRYVNRRFAETLGYGLAELGGEMKVQDVIHPEDWPLVKENLRRRMSGELESLHYEFRMVTKNGEVRDGEVYSSRTAYKGRPAVIGTLLDITGRKRSHGLLRQAEEQYRSIFENAVEGIFRATPDGALAEVNGALARMSGCRTPEETIAFFNERRGQLCVHPEQSAELKRSLDEKGWAKGFEIDLYRKDGGIMCASVKARAIRAKDGSLLRYEGMIEDITKRRRAEDALTRSEAELRALVESMSDIIMVVDRNGRFTKILAEPEWLSETGDGVRGSTLKRIFPEETASLFLKSVRRALTILRTVNMDHSLQIRGKEHWFSTAISPMSDGSAVCVARDITDLKMAERALQAKSLRLEETNTALKVLLANMEEAKKEVEETMASNLRMLVLPYIEKLARMKLSAIGKAYVDVVEENLRNIASPLLRGLGRFNLTPTEIQVANYIKDGKTTKEIMTLLNISKGAVDTHRYKIRRKVGINKEKVNLCSHLRTIR